MDHFRYFFVLVFLSGLFIAVLFLTLGKGWPLGSLERDVFFLCVFVTFPCGVLSQVVCLIVQIPNFCLVTY